MHGGDDDLAGGNLIHNIGVKGLRISVSIFTLLYLCFEEKRRHIIKVLLLFCAVRSTGVLRQKLSASFHAALFGRSPSPLYRSCPSLLLQLASVLTTAVAG